MRNKYKKFLIVSTILIFTGIGYLYFSNDLNKESAVPIASGSSLASSLGIESPMDQGMDEGVASDISFLTTLVSLKTLKIDTSLFSDQSFNALVNNAVKIEPVKAGRINPFAPMDESSINGSTVTTDQPTQIASRTAVLNGTVSTSSVVTDTYFEYGVSAQTLTSLAAATKQSLVGTFIKNVSGLIPKTTYFSRACAKINNVALCGETVSFTTN